MTDEDLKKASVVAAIGTTAGVASSFMNVPPGNAHNMVANVAAKGGRVATDAMRQSLRSGSSVGAAIGAGATAVGTAAAGGVSAAAAATGAAVVAAAPFVAVATVVGLVGYGLYKLFED